jgi:alpha/beta superfamily hydrolase
LVTTVSMREYHLDFIQIYHSLVEDFNIPIQFIQADPPPYGDVLFEQINEMIQHLKEHSKNTVDVISMNGTHHFHMLKPAETADIVLKFLVKKVYFMNSKTREHLTCSQ